MKNRYSFHSISQALRFAGSLSFEVAGCADGSAHSLAVDLRRAVLCFHTRQASWFAHMAFTGERCSA